MNISELTRLHEEKNIQWELFTNYGYDDEGNKYVIYHKRGEGQTIKRVT